MPLTFRDAERDAELDFESLKEQFKEARPILPVVLCDVEGRFVDDDGNPVSAVTATDENYVWAREWGESSPSPYLNRRNILTTTGTPCWAGYDESSLEKEILGLFIINPSLTRRQVQDNHAREHEPGGYQPVNVYLRMLVPLRVTPLSGLVVQVAPLVYEFNGSPVIYPGTNTLDLTSNLPGAGLARYTLIYLDPADNTAKTINGTAITDSLAFTPPLPTPPDQSYPSAWVRLSPGQPQISEAQDIVDGRMILSRYGDADYWPGPGEILIGGVDYGTLVAAAAAAVAGDLVLIGPGTFNHSASVTFADGVNVTGSGVDITILNATDDNLTITIGNVSGDPVLFTNLTVKNLGAGPAPAFSAVADNGTIIVEDVKVFAPNITGIIVAGDAFSTVSLINVRSEADIAVRLDVNADLELFLGFYNGATTDIVCDTSQVGIRLTLPTLAHSTFTDVSNSIDGWWIDFGTGDLRTRASTKLLLSGSASIDLNGVDNALILDADADTSIDASTDDQIDLRTGGSVRATLTDAGLALSAGARLNEFSTDGTMGGNSDLAAPTEKAVKTYVNTLNSAKVSSLAASDLTPDPAWSVDATGNLSNPGGGSIDFDGRMRIVDGDADSYYIADIDDQETVVMGSSQIYLVKSTGMTFSAGKDVYLGGDEAGAKQRLADIYYASITDHFDTNSLSGDWAWAAYSGFVTPANINLSTYPSVLALYNSDAQGAARAFMYYSSFVNDIFCRCAPLVNTRAGLRIDDGSNSNYVEWFLERGSSGNVTARYRYALAGAVTGPTTVETFGNIEWVVLRLTHISNVLGGYYHFDTPRAANSAGIGSVTFTATRSGIYHENLTGVGLSLDRASYYDWYKQ